MVSFLLPTALVAVSLISSLNAFSLDSEENRALQETCGADMKDDRYSRKVLNGVAAHHGETPWSVAVYIPDSKGDAVYTTGTLISNRHVISYDQLFIMNTTSGIQHRHNMEFVDFSSCDDGTDLVLPKSVSRYVSVFADLLKADRFSGRKELQVSSIRILNGCETPYQMNRVVVIELVKPVDESHKAKPVCIASDIIPPTPVFTFYGFGDNRGEVKDATLRHTTIVEVPCDNPSDSFFCVKSVNPLCNGDFGGAAVKKVSGAIRAFGVYVNGPYECAKANADTVYTFANMTTLANDICEVTGVCASDLEEPTTTTEMPETIATESLDTTEYPEQNPPLGRDGTTDDIEYGVTTPGTYGGEETVETDPPIVYIPGIDDITTTTESYETTMSANNEGNVRCVPESDDDDIHIHIKLGKYIQTGNELDIEIIRQGPKKLSKRAI